MDFTLILGLIAGFLTTVAYVPEVIKVFSTKDTKGISLLWLLTLLTGALLWFYYGVLIISIPVMAANGVSAFLILMLIFLKIKYK
ncbi:MAG: SemiSWEET family sugar transporter [Nitrososphaeria archaeon]|jgi:MtN3 and saliva related transmembrane protein